MFAKVTARRRNQNRAAFTLVEIMIVVLIIGILLGIAVPNFIRARETSRSKACIANLKQIDTAKEQYAMDQKLSVGDTSIAADALNGASTLSGPGGYIKASVVCPASGVYTVGNIGTNPSCSFNAAAPSYAPHSL